MSEHESSSGDASDDDLAGLEDEVLDSGRQLKVMRVVKRRRAGERRSTAAALAGWRAAMLGQATAGARDMGTCF
jgi:hypothetical protein